jgi:hypothetical protein
MSDEEFAAEAAVDRQRLAVVAFDPNAAGLHLEDAAAKMFPAQAFCKIGFTVDLAPRVHRHELLLLQRKIVSTHRLGLRGFVCGLLLLPNGVALELFRIRTLRRRVQDRGAEIRARGCCAQQEQKRDSAQG